MTKALDEPKIKLVRAVRFIPPNAAGRSQPYALLSVKKSVDSFEGIDFDRSAGAGPGGRLAAAFDVGSKLFDGEAALDPADVRLGQDKPIEQNVVRRRKRDFSAVLGLLLVMGFLSP